MVLEDLGASLTKALSTLASKTVIDDEALGELLKDIQRALLLADVNVQLVSRPGAPAGRRRGAPPPGPPGRAPPRPAPGGAADDPAPPPPAQVQKLTKNVKEAVSQEIANAEAINRRSVIEQAVFRELVRMLDSGVPDKSPSHPRNLKKGTEHVVMFVGLQVRDGAPPARPPPRRAPVRPPRRVGADPPPSTLRARRVPGRRPPS